MLKEIRFIREVARSIRDLDPKIEYERESGLSPTQYSECFAEGRPKLEPEKSAGKSRHEKALEQAYEQRKFEIELYWKRATYFWTFIGAAFVGYAAFLSGSTPHLTGALVMSQVGLVFTVAWYLVNRGSKYWQENWENHVCLLEDEVSGPIYKMSATRDPNESSDHNKWDRRWISPKPTSVSKINTIISMYVIFIWIVLGLAVIGMWAIRLFEIDLHGRGWQLGIHLPVIAGVIWSTCFAWRVLWRQSSTHQGEHTPLLIRRKVTVTKSVKKRN